MTHQLQTTLARASVLIGASALISLSGCGGDQQEDDAQVAGGPVADGSLESAQKQAELTDGSLDLRLITGHVPHLVDATSGEHEYTNRLINQTSPYLL